MRCPKYVVLPSISGATYKQTNQQTTLPRSVNYKSVMKARAKTTKLTVSSPTKVPSIPSAPSELCGSCIYSIHSTLFMYEINLCGPNRATVIFLPLTEQGSHIPKLPLTDLQGDITQRNSYENVEDPTKQAETIRGHITRRYVYHNVYTRYTGQYRTSLIVSTRNLCKFVYGGGFYFLFSLPFFSYFFFYSHLHGLFFFRKVCIDSPVQATRKYRIQERRILPIFSLGAPSAAVLSWMEFSTQTHVAHTSLSPSVSVIPLLSRFLPVALPLVRSFSVCLSPFTPTTLFPFHPRDLSCASSAILAGRYSSVTPSVSFDSCISTGV